MMRTIEPILYTCLIEEMSQERPFVQVYWARAPHLGAALEKMMHAARENGFEHPEPREADPYDIENLPDELRAVSAADVFWSNNRYHWQPRDPIFELPHGVIASCIEGDHLAEEIARGYITSQAEDGIWTITVNVERGELLSLYSKLLSLRQSYKAFWYLLHDHWDDEADIFLTNKDMSVPQNIMSHIESHPLDSLQNGFITLTAYLQEGRVNLNISDHKNIVILTYSDELASLYCDTLEEAGYFEDDGLISINTRMYHWHYRHPDSNDKKPLIEMLRQLGFADWKPPHKGKWLPCH